MFCYSYYQYYWICMHFKRQFYKTKKEGEREGKKNLDIGQVEFMYFYIYIYVCVYIARWLYNANNALFIHGRALRGGKPGVARDPGANLPPGKFKWKRGTGVGG